MDQENKNSPSLHSTARHDMRQSSNTEKICLKCNRVRFMVTHSSPHTDECWHSYSYGSEKDQVRRGSHQ
jgi:hypothetical protein